MNLLQTEQRVPADRETVFPFFARPENLAVITPPWLRFRALTPSPIPMREGALIDYRISLGPFPLRWRSLITAFDPPRGFVDEQLLGPYSFWHHAHRFEEAEGGTLLLDEVHYLLPCGPLGALAHGLAVRRQLEAIFSYRQRVIASRFGGEEPPAPPVFSVVEG